MLTVPYASHREDDVNRDGDDEDDVESGRMITADHGSIPDGISSDSGVGFL